MKKFLLGFFVGSSAGITAFAWIVGDAERKGMITLNKNWKSERAKRATAKSDAGDVISCRSQRVKNRVP